MNYCSRITHQSSVCPGVSFTLNKMNEKRRVTRELAICDLRARIQTTNSALQASIAANNLPDAKPGVIDKKNAELDHLINAEWYPAWIKWGLYSIDGLDIDDKPATADSLIDSGPSDLVDEIFKAIWAASGLGVVEGESSPSVGTSAAPADGKTSSSTAPGANEPVGTDSATAVSISPAK